MIRRIRKVLRLETEARALLVDAALFSLNTAIQKVAGIKLYSRFRRVYLEHSSRYRFADARGKLEGIVCPVDHKIVVVSPCQGHLVKRRINMSAYGSGRSQVERGPLHG